MSDLSAIQGAADHAEHVIAGVAKISESTEPAIQKRLAAAPDVVRANPQLLDEYKRGAVQEVRTAALTAADELAKKEDFYPRVSSLLAKEHRERWTFERCLERVRFKSDDPSPESLTARMQHMTAGELVGLLDDAARADRGAIALLIHRAILSRAGRPDASEQDGKAAKRSAELLATIRVREFDEAERAFKRLDAAEAWMRYHRGAITTGYGDPVLRVQAHRRAA